MKIIKHIIRVLTGSVFIFSGIVKAIDPLGSTYKFNDYFQAFHLDFLGDLSLPLAFALCAGEFIVGFSLVSGIRLRAGIIGVLFFMIIFTPLTFFLAIFNPVSDCGCFGDAVHLTTWQTFLKNIIISGFAIFLYRTNRDNTQTTNEKKEWFSLLAVIVLFVSFTIYNLRHLPLLDFLPYKIGTTISEGMIIPEGAAADQFEVSFIYEKEGEQKEYTLADYPSNDTTWKFVSQKSRIIKKGYEPPIHDFSITSRTGDDITDLILDDPDYSLIMIAKKLSEASPANLEKGFTLGASVMSEDLNFYVLTASSRSETDGLYNGLEFCFADETTLKTIVRANPGFVLIKDGVIIGKWASIDVPDKEWFTSNLTGKQLSSFYKDSENISIFLILFTIIGLLFLLCILLKKSLKLKSINK